MSRANEIYSFAETCKCKGWSEEKTCNALGIQEQDIPLISHVYSHEAFTIFGSDDEDY